MGSSTEGVLARSRSLVVGVRAAEVEVGALLAALLAIAAHFTPSTGIAGLEGLISARPIHIVVKSSAAAQTAEGAGCWIDYRRQMGCNHPTRGTDSHAAKTLLIAAKLLLTVLTVLTPSSLD